MSRKIHGLWNTRTYKSWQQMKSRCRDSCNASYKFYGALGISYDPSWEDFQTFVEDMGLRPQNMSLDRIDNYKSYSKANCKWSTAKEQANNRTNNVKVEFQDSMFSVQELVILWGKSDSAVRHRLATFFKIDNDGVYRQVREIKSRNRVSKLVKES